jgi:hypothetical protein
VKGFAEKVEKFNFIAGKLTLGACNSAMTSKQHSNPWIRSRSNICGPYKWFKTGFRTTVAKVMMLQYML